MDLLYSIKIVIRIISIGIPLKRSEKNITYEKAVHMSALVADLWNVTRKCIQRELRSLDVRLFIILE